MKAVRAAALPVLALSVLIACFLLPAMLNRAPILYPDSVGYYQSGRAAAVAALSRLDPEEPADARKWNGWKNPGLALATPEDGITTARSVYYGIPFFLGESWLGPWAMPLFQSATALAALWLAARHALGHDRTGIAVTIALTALVAGAGAFASVLMPDIFAGLLVLSISVLAVYRREMGWAERLFWLTLATLAILFHKSHIAIAIALIATGLLVSLRVRLLDRHGLVAMIVPLLLGVTGHAAVDITLRTMGQTPVSPPFLLARVIGDGTGEAYLRKACPTRPFYTCRFLDKMPMTENEFLWTRDPATGAFGTLDGRDRARVIAEQDDILIGTLRQEGLRQLELSMFGAVRQFFTVGIVEYGLAPRFRSTDPAFDARIKSYGASAIATGTMPLKALSAVMLLSYLVGWALLIRELLRRRGRTSDDKDQRLIAAWIMAGIGVVINAAICGMISGIFDRYQGRVAWLMLFFALVLLTGRWRRARGDDDAAAPAAD